MELLLAQAEGINAYGERTYVLSFAPNGSSDPTALFGCGVASVKYAATGLWQIQLDDSGFTRLLWFDGAFKNASGGPGQGFQIELDSTTNLDTGLLVVTSVNTSGTRATIAADANTVCYLRFSLSKNPLDT